MQDNKYGEAPYIAKLKSTLEARDVNLLDMNYSKAYWSKAAKRFYNWPREVQELFVQAMQMRHGSDMRDFKTAMRLESDARDMWCVVHEPKLGGIVSSTRLIVSGKSTH